jgi:hypothetical protein
MPSEDRQKTIESSTKVTGKPADDGRLRWFLHS